MARVIGLDFVHDSVYAVELTGSAKEATVAAAFTATLPTELAPEHSDQLGHWLRDRLAEAGFRGSDTVVTLGRNRVPVKWLHVPECPDHELPAIIAFTVNGELQPPGLPSVLDFQAEASHEGERAVLAASTPERVVECVLAVCKVAKLNCRVVSLTHFAGQFLYRQLSEKGRPRASLLAVPAGDTIDLSAWSGDQLVLCRTVPTVGSDEERMRRIALEVRRTLAAVSTAMPDAEVDTIAYIGQAAEETRAAFAERIGAAIEIVDPHARLRFGPIADAREFTSVVGAAWRELAGAGWPINFAKPKKTVDVRHQRRPSLVMVLALAALLPVMGYAYGRWRIAERDSRIETFTQEIARIDGEIAKLKTTVRRHQVVKEWVDSEVHWLDELHDLALSSPDTSEAFWTSATFSCGEQGKQGTIELEGKARSDAVITAMQTLWANDAHMHYTLTPGSIDPTNDNSEFNWRFSFLLSVNPLKPQVYVQRGTGWQEKFRRAVPPESQREPVGFSSANTMFASGRGPASETNGERRERREERRRNEGTSASPAATSSDTPATASSTPAASSGGADDVMARWLAQLKDLSYEEREKKIGEAPTFLRARIRRELEKLRTP